jgi:hypothetical protein
MPRRRPGVVPGAVVAVAGLVAGSAITLLLKPPVAAPDLLDYKFTALSREEAEERSPRWAPDGNSIAYTTRVHGLMQVFTKRAGTPDAVQLTKADQKLLVPFSGRPMVPAFITFPAAACGPSRPRVTVRKSYMRKLRQPLFIRMARHWHSTAAANCGPVLYRER